MTSVQKVIKNVIFICQLYDTRVIIIIFDSPCWMNKKSALIFNVLGNAFQTRDNQIYQEGRDVVTVCEWTDRIYQNTQPEHIITNVVSGRKMRVQKYNFPDTVIWNPWLDKARDIPDFGDDEFPNMICVESGHVSSPVILLPGTAFEASQILQVRIFFNFLLPYHEK